MKSPPPTIEATPAGADFGLWRRLVREGRAAWRVEARGEARRRTHLQSAKILDAGGAFLCEATLLDVSALGLRLRLARNCGLAARIGVHLDLTGELLTATPVWRRERLVGARVIAAAPPAAMKPSDRLALRGRYYAIPG